MDPRLLAYYNRELQHVREMGAEFAKAYPKIAGRLGLEGFDCADPYVERLLEGFAYLAARVQLKVDAEFPRFTQHLLEMVYPHYLAPMPSMAVVKFDPDLNEGALGDGFPIPRGSRLRGQIGKGEQTACEYSVAHDTLLWPLQLLEAEYLSGAGAVANQGVASRPALKAGIRLRFKATAGLKFNQLKLDRLPIYLCGSGSVPMFLYEQVLGNCIGMVAKPVGETPKWQCAFEPAAVRRTGFDDEQALLPYTRRSFQGYRLLQEYFAFPERFLFFELTGLHRALAQCEEDMLDVIILLDRSEGRLIRSVDKSNFELFCTPAINLFEKRTDRIHLSDRFSEYHIVPDRTRPMDFEVYQVGEVTGFGSGPHDEQEFLPFYEVTDHDAYGERLAFYTLHREQRLLSTKQRLQGPRSSYVGSEVFISIVDAHEVPYRTELKQLGLKTLCTNRDLPLHMPVGAGKSDFSLQIGAPVAAIRCLTGPTKPRSSFAHKDVAWKLISHLSLNYLSLLNNNQKEGAAALRNMLQLYGDSTDPAVRRQIEGLLSVSSKAVVRRINSAGPLVFGRGLQIDLTLDETAFEGNGVFLFGAVLEQFFARYVSINSFTETVVNSSERGEVMRWPARIGNRHAI